MLTEAFALVLQLPPLAFGPALPVRAFDPPNDLVCAVQDLGRIQEPVRPPRPAFLSTSLDPRALRPDQLRHLINPAMDFFLVLGALAATRGGWDDRSWQAHFWSKTGAITPVQFPPQMLPPQTLGR